MIKLFKQVAFLLEKKDKIKIFYIFALSMINALLEVLSIGLVIPFVKILTSEQLFIDYPFLNNRFASGTNISQTEIPYLKSRRTLYYNNNLSKNQKLKKIDLKRARPGIGLSIKNIDKIVGKKLRKNVKIGMPASSKDFY